jgi:hypothetical protein
MMGFGAGRKRNALYYEAIVIALASQLNSPTILKSITELQGLPVFSPFHTQNTDLPP